MVLDGIYDGCYDGANAERELDEGGLKGVVVVICGEGLGDGGLEKEKKTPRE